MAEEILRVTEPDDPRRCKSLGKDNNQCMNMGIKLPDGTYTVSCIIHGGANQRKNFKVKELKNYSLTKFRAKIGRMANSDNIKSLRDEIGILRIMLETLINRCEDESDLLIESHRISDLVDKISQLVTGCHKIEGSMGQLIDKQAILMFASEVVEIVANAITDKIVLEKISSGIMTSLGRLGQEEDGT